MTLDAALSSQPGPAPVAIHDNGYVLGQPTLVQALEIHSELSLTVDERKQRGWKIMRGPSNFHDLILFCLEDFVNTSDILAGDLLNSLLPLF